MPRGEKRRWLTKVRWADVLAFLPRGQLLPLSITSGRFLAPHCAAVLLPEKKRTVKDLLIRWSQIAKRNQVEVWRGFPKDYESVPFPVTAPPTGIAGFKEINVVNRICPATLRFFQLSRLLAGCELVIEDWYAFCARHEISFVDDFLEVFKGRVHRVEVDRPTAETEPFLGHPAVQNCARLAVFDPAADFGWTELVDWLHRPLRLLRKGGVEEVGGSFESDQFQQGKQNPSIRVLQLEANEHTLAGLVDPCVMRLKTAAAKKLSSSSNPATPTSPLSAFFVSSTVNYVVKIFNGEEWLPRDALTVENETTGERLQLEHHATGPCSRYHVLRRWATGADDCFPTPPTSPATPISRNLHFEALFNDVADESRTKVVVQMLDEEAFAETNQ